MGTVWRRFRVLVLTAIKDAARQRARRVNRAKLRLPVQEAAGVAILRVIQQIADELLRTGSDIAVDGAALSGNARFSLGVSERDLDEQPLTAAPATAVTDNRVMVFDAQFAFVLVVEVVVVELMIVDAHTGMVPWSTVRPLRFDGESDAEFRARAEKAAVMAKVLSDACLANRCVQSYIADPALPFWTEDYARRSPTVRIEYEQAIAIGGIGETLQAARNKSWGDGPYVLPLEPDDEFYATRITYLYRENSLYNRRFEQRQRMKELLGRRYRRLVGDAKSRYTTKTIFLRDLRDDERQAIERVFDVDPGTFWRACKGKVFLDLPPRQVQLELDFGDEDH